MAEHEKAFLVCENKCFVEGMSKEEIINRTSYLPNDVVVVGKFDNADVRRHIVNANQTNITYSDSKYSFSLDYSSVSQSVVDAYVMITKIYLSGGRYTNHDFEKVPCVIKQNNQNHTLTIEFNHALITGVDILSVNFRFVFEEY